MDGSPSKVKKARSTAGCPSSRNGDGAVNACEVILCRSFSSIPCSGEQNASILSIAAVGVGAIVGEGEGVSCGVCVGSALFVAGIVCTGVVVFTTSTGDAAVAQAASVKTITRHMHSTATIFQKYGFLAVVACLRISLKRGMIVVGRSQDTILRASM